MADNIFDFIGGNEGEWQVTRMQTVVGGNLERITHLKVMQGSLSTHPEGRWALKGLVSNIRYAEKAEKEQLLAVQSNLGRPSATMAALIPIRKNEAWWNLAQDERRKIFEETSHHTAVGLEYLPAIARKLFHCRDIGEPFDFLTWFEYAPEHAQDFEILVKRLRETQEWTYIDREIDIRLMRTNVSKSDLPDNWKELGGEKPFFF